MSKSSNPSAIGMPEIAVQTAADDAAVEALVARIFGPAITTRAAHVLRGDAPAIAGLAYTARHDGNLIGTVRLTPIRWGVGELLMLGPLGVAPEWNGRGIGRRLMQVVMEAAVAHPQATHWRAVMLVGDRAYYAPFGFEPVPHGAFEAPLPVDPARVLIAPLVEGGAEGWQGSARPL